MKRAAIILVSMIVFTSLYGQYIKTTEAFGLVSYFLPMIAANFFTVKLLLKNRVERITIPLCLILHISTVAHSLGAMSWITYNHPITDLYVQFGYFLLLSELLVFMWGGYARIPNRGRSKHNIYYGDNTYWWSRDK